MNEVSTMKIRAIAAVLITLSFFGTLFIRIPIPATNGYFNIGDIFVVLSGLWLGPWYGFLVGFIGPTLADLVGFPQFFLATAVTKGIEGFVVGIIARNAVTGATTGKMSVVAASCGGAVMVLGYFIFEAVIYPELGKYISFFNVTTLSAAISEIPFNIVQAFFGAVGGYSLWKGMSGKTLKKQKEEGE